MQFAEFHAILKKRSAIEEEWYTEIEKCWEEMTNIFSQDINKTILFLEICRADEFSLLSEVFEDIAQNTHSRDFIAALRKTAKKYPAETQHYNIVDFIESAECIVNDKDEA